MITEHKINPLFMAVAAIGTNEITKTNSRRVGTAFDFLLVDTATKSGAGAYYVGCNSHVMVVAYDQEADFGKARVNKFGVNRIVFNDLKKAAKQNDQCCFAINDEDYRKSEFRVLDGLTGTMKRSSLIDAENGDYPRWRKLFEDEREADSAEFVPVDAKYQKLIGEVGVLLNANVALKNGGAQNTVIAKFGSKNGDCLPVVMLVMPILDGVSYGDAYPFQI